MHTAQLIEQCRTGDRSAFGQLYILYKVPMLKVIGTYIHKIDVAHDILHDGFIIAFQSLDSLKQPARFESWLTTIMRNLSLQYLREKSSRISISMSENMTDNILADDTPVQDLSYNEIDRIIRRLPDGYQKVFRLAVLDGLSHKEIAKLLGIAPHSSSSQLSHAKAMLRKLITEYRVEKSMLAIVAIALFVWHGIVRQKNDSPSCMKIMQKTKDITRHYATDTIIGNSSKLIFSKPETDNTAASKPNTQLAQKKQLTTDTTYTVIHDSVAYDSPNTPSGSVNEKEPIVQSHLPITKHSEVPAWSLSLAYSGIAGRSNTDRYHIQIGPDLDISSDKPETIEVEQQTHHHVPLVIGLSLNKSLTSRWSIETGLRYTFLQSDFLTESKLTYKEMIQRIHYIGIPLKINYIICRFGGFSLYGQGGGAIDIPVNSRQAITEFQTGIDAPSIRRLHIHPPLQWSVEGGIGLQYNFTPWFSIYAEPSFRYYFNTNHEIKTIRQEQPFEFSIPIGLRVMW